MDHAAHNARCEGHHGRADFKSAHKVTLAAGRVSIAAMQLVN
ncbi:hypothetical protein ACWDVX_14515 [Streptomyces tendae]